MGFWKDVFGGPKDSGSQPGKSSGGSGEPKSGGKIHYTDYSKVGSDQGHGSWDEDMRTGEVSRVHGTSHTEK